MEDPICLKCLKRRINIFLKRKQQNLYTLVNDFSAFGVRKISGTINMTIALRHVNNALNKGGLRRIAPYLLHIKFVTSFRGATHRAHTVGVAYCSHTAVQL